MGHARQLTLQRVSAVTARLRPMVDVATVSVVSSAAVALGTLAVNFIGNERQRKHEADLDFERRAWDRKSEALFSLMEECRFLIDSDIPITDSNRQAYALDLSRSLDRLHGVRAAVDAFASTRCRIELTGIMDVMQSGGVKHHSGEEARRYLNYSVETDIDDIEMRRRWRELEDAGKARAVENFDPNMNDIRARAARLLDATRESVRRPKE